MQEQLPTYAAMPSGRARSASETARRVQAFLNRRTFLGAAASVTLSLSGCSWSRSVFHPTTFVEDSTADARGSEPTVPNIVNILNERATLVRGWRATQAKVTYYGPRTYTLDSMIHVEAPRNFSLVARSIRGSEVELGSNDERFWFWVKDNEPNVILTARHSDLGIAQKRFPLPFQPEWLVEVLGVVPIDEGTVRVEDAPSSPTGQPRVFVVSDRVNAQGQPVTKAMLVDTSHALVLQHELISEARVPIARAELHHYTIEPKTKVPLPGLIKLDWPAAKTKLDIKVGSMDINPAFPPKTWVLPEIPNCPLVDLGDPDAPDNIGPEPKVRPASQRRHRT